MDYSSHVNSSLKLNQILNAYLQSTFLVALILVLLEVCKPYSILCFLVHFSLLSMLLFIFLGPSHQFLQK